MNSDFLTFSIGSVLGIALVGFLFLILIIRSIFRINTTIGLLEQIERNTRKEHKPIEEKNS